MNAEIFAWLVPFALATFSFVFLALRMNGIGSFWWAAAFALSAFAFGSSLVPVEEGAVAKPLAEDVAFLFAFACFACGSAIRVGGTPAFVFLALAILAGTIGATVALAVFGSVRGELVVVQTTGALILFDIARSIRRRMRHGPDRALLVLSVAFALNLLLQSLALIFLADPSMTVATWTHSPWGFALQASGATGGVLFAVLTLLAVGRDMMDALRSVSETDPLSGVLNRRGLEIRAERLGIGGTSVATASLVLLDVDHFKRVNDQYGHLAGDAVICAVAAMAREIGGPAALVARLGGEEFVLLVPDCDLRRAHGLAETMRQTLVAIRWPAPMQDLKLTASFGVTDVGTGELLAYVTDRADRLLYLAKERGRNQVCSLASGSRIVAPDPNGIGHPGGLMHPSAENAAA